MEYGSVEDEHKPLYEMENSDRAFEEEVLFTGFGSAPVKGEGESVTYDTAGEGYVSRWNHETISLAFALTEEAMEDNLYDSFAKLRAKALARAMANTKQVKAADVFNNGFSTSFPIGDAAAFFSAAHPTKSDGSQSNLLTAADLAQASLETALTSIQKIKDDRGILVGGAAECLHIAPDEWAVAETLLASPGKPGGELNDINAIRSMGMLPKGFFINRRFTDADAWFVKTNCPNGTKMFVRVPLQTKMEPDFDTGNLRFKSRERYSFGIADWRQWFGNAGTG
jgi:hypothetical protein